MADITKLTNVDWTDEDQRQEAIDAVCELIAVKPDDEKDEKVKAFVTRLQTTVADIANAVMADEAGEGAEGDDVAPEGEEVEEQEAPVLPADEEEMDESMKYSTGANRYLF